MDYEGLRMGGSWQNGIGNNMAIPRFISGLKYFKRKDNGGCDELTGKFVWKNLGFQQGISNEAFI